MSQLFYSIMLSSSIYLNVNPRYTKDCFSLLCSGDSSHPIQVWCIGRLQLLQGTAAPLIFYTVPNIMFIFCCWILLYKPANPCLLPRLGNSGSGAPVSEDSTVAAHTPRAATARILQLHVRRTHAKIRTVCFTALEVMTLVKLVPPSVYSPLSRSDCPSGWGCERSVERRCTA